ncbi:MAG: amino acid permease [Micrococcaceae bacterium]
MSETLNTKTSISTVRQTQLEAEEAGYEKGLGRRQMQMIAIGGAIGTGLFLGAGGRLEKAGPSLAVVYLVCGIFGFFILRALGEMVLHRPASGAIVSYTREFIGEHAAFVSGWLYFMFWALTGIVDATAVATYMKYWGLSNESNQWFIALLCIALVTAVNLIGVKYFGEMEFWFAVVKVTALLIFLLVGIVFVGGRIPVNGVSPGFHMISENGGLFPHGFLPAVVITQGVVFAYAGIEMVGVAAGETESPEKVVPKAVNAVIWRIAIFYVGAVVLLVMLMPFSKYSEDESPFVTFFNNIGIPGAGGVMNFVVITAALSSLNSGVFATARTLRSMGMAGAAPSFTKKMNKNHVPVGGILLTVSVSLLGVILNYIMPAQAFEIVLNYSSLGIICVWIMIMLTHLAYRKAIAEGKVVEKNKTFKLMFSPITDYVTIGFLLLVLVLMYFDKPVGQWTILSIPLIAVVFFIGWKIAKPKIEEVDERWKENQQ